MIELDLFTYDREDEFRYVEVDGGIEVVAYEGAKKYIAIPECIHGKTVVGIGTCREAYIGKKECVLKIPKTVRYIDAKSNPLGDRKWYEKFYLDPKNPFLEVEDGFLYSKDKKILYMCFENKNEIIIPDCVERIESMAFYYNVIFFAPVKLPKQIKYIGHSIANQYVFERGNRNYFIKDKCVYTADGKTLVQCFDRECKKLELADGVEEILPYACEKLSKLTQIVWNGKIKKIGDYAFKEAVIKTIRLPETLEQLSHCAFGYKKCTSIRVEKENKHYRSDGICLYEMKEDGTEILMKCFKNDIEEYVVPNTVIEVVDGAFQDCDELKNLMLSNSLQIWHSSCVSAKIRKINLPASVNEMNCTKNKLSYTIAEDNPYYFIEEGVLYHRAKDGFEVLQVDDNVTTVQFKEGTVRIDSLLFEHSRIKKVILPSTLQYITNTAFYKCPLEEYEMSAENQFYTTEAGMLYNKDKTVLIHVPSLLKQKKIVLPESVIEIGRAFYNCTQIEEIVLSNNIQAIWKDALYCSVQRIYFGDKIKYIDDAAIHIWDKTKLKIYGERNSYVEQYVFDLKEKQINANIAFIPNGCEDISELSNEYELALNDTGVTILRLLSEEEIVHVPEKIGNYLVTDFGKRVFSSKNNLKYVTLPNGIKKITEGMFDSCHNLIKLEIPEGVTEIEASAFFYCSKLKILRVPASVTKISEKIFTGKNSLYKDLGLNEDALLFLVQSDSYAETFFKSYKINNYKRLRVLAEDLYPTFTLKNPVMDELNYRIGEDGTVSVGIKVNVEELNVPEQAYGLPVTTFMMGSNLMDIKVIRIPKTITSIQGINFRVFGTQLEQFLVEEENPMYYADGCALYTKDKTKLIKMFVYNQTTYTVCHETKIIGEYAFTHFDKLKKVILPEGLEEIQNGAFYGCSSLSEVDGLETVKNIEDNVFIGTEFQKNQKVIIANGRLKKCHVMHEKKFIVPMDVTEIESDAFRLGYTNEVDKLEEVVIPDTVTKIGSGAFWGRTALKKVHLPANLKKIEANVFEDCSLLESIHIPKGVKEIDLEAFATRGRNVWHSPSALREFTVDEENTVYCAKDGVLYSKDMTKLYLVPNAIAVQKFVVPDSVQEIVAYAFSYNQYIEEVVLPKSVQVIQRETFTNCKKLQFINLESVIKIEQSAFRECLALKQVRFEHVKEIQHFAFNNTGLTSVFLPESLETIGEDAFLDCEIEKVIVPKTVKQISRNAFVGCNDITIYDTLEPHARDCKSAIEYYYKPDTAKIGRIGTSLPSENRYRTWYNHVITVRSAQTNEIKYQVIMKADSKQEAYGRILLYGWGKNATFDFSSQDEFFPDIKGASIKLEVAMNRLRYQIDLSENNKTMYVNYLVKNAKELVRQCILARDIEFLQVCEPFGVLKKAHMEELIAFANEQKATEFVAYLMDYQNEHFATTKKKSNEFSLSEKLPKPPKEWQMSKKGLSKVDRYKGTETSVIFPEELKGVKVTGIANTTIKVPENYLNLVSVVIPEGYETIGDYAFFGCKNLERITLPSTLQSIGNNAFEGCEKLKEIILPDGIQMIEKGTFKDCGKLEKVILSANLQKIQSYAFYGCEKLKEIDIPASVIELGVYSFAESGLETVIIRGMDIVENVIGGEVFTWPVFVYGHVSVLQKISGIAPQSIRPLGVLDGSEVFEDVYADIAEKRLKGKTFVVTGDMKTFPIREYLKKFIISHGGRMTGSVSKKTSYLIANDQSEKTSKLAKAQELGTPIITEEEFLKMVRR